MARAHTQSRAGFTLIELLIVILIIGILAGLIMGGLALVREKANIAASRAMINALDNGVRVFREDTGYYPGTDASADPEDPDSNVIALVVRTLHTKGLVTLKEQDLYVRGEAYNPQSGPEEDDGCEQATKDQADDPEQEITVVDPFGKEYIARENESKVQKKGWMHNKQGMDIYSKGKNRIDDTALETEGTENDDLGNW